MQNITFLDLPPEIQVLAFSFFDIDNVHSVNLTNTNFHDLVGMAEKPIVQNVKAIWKITFTNENTFSSLIEAVNSANNLAFEIFPESKKYNGSIFKQFKFHRSYIHDLQLQKLEHIFREGILEQKLRRAILDHKIEAIKDLINLGALVDNKALILALQINDKEIFNNLVKGLSETPKEYFYKKLMFQRALLHEEETKVGSKKFVKFLIKTSIAQLEKINIALENS